LNSESFFRSNQLPDYVFAEMHALKAKAKSLGKNIYDFSLGNPDGDPPDLVVQALHSSMKSGSFRYPEPTGSLNLKKAMARWYKKKFFQFLAQRKVLVIYF
jgi:alanine-synthesizing transaminase